MYEDDEWLVGLYDNTKELANATGMDFISVSTRISRLFHNKRKKLYIDGKGYNVSFIELTDYDLQILNERGN